MRAGLFALSALVVVTLAAFPALSQDADPAKGKQTYTVYCVTCHGEAGDGQGPVGKTLNPPPRNFKAAEFKFGGTDQDIFDVISNGAASKGGSPLMAPWGAVIPEADRWDLVAYIRTLQAD